MMETMVIKEGADEITLYSCENFRSTQPAPFDVYCDWCGQCNDCHNKSPEWYNKCQHCPRNVCTREMFEGLCADCYNKKEGFDL